MGTGLLGGGLHAGGRIAVDGVTLVGDCWNVVSSVHNGAGDVTVTLGQGIGQSQAIPYVAIENAGATTAIGFRFLWLTETTIQFLFFDAAGGAADAPFAFGIPRSSPT